VVGGPATLLTLAVAAWCLSLGVTSGCFICFLRVKKRLLGLGLWPGKKYIIPLKTFPSRSKMLDYLEEVYWGEELRTKKQPSGQLIPSFKVILT
jgi:hypothetical protein